MSILLATGPVCLCGAVVLGTGLICALAIVAVCSKTAWRRRAAITLLLHILAMLADKHHGQAVCSRVHSGSCASCGFRLLHGGFAGE
jgi:hypothetical protein